MGRRRAGDGAPGALALCRAPADVCAAAEDLHPTKNGIQDERTYAEDAAHVRERACGYRCGCGGRWIHRCIHLHILLHKHLHIHRPMTDDSPMWLGIAQACRINLLFSLLPQASAVTATRSPPDLQTTSHGLHDVGCDVGCAASDSLDHFLHCKPLCFISGIPHLSTFPHHGQTHHRDQSSLGFGSPRLTSVAAGAHTSVRGEIRRDVCDCVSLYLCVYRQTLGRLVGARRPRSAPPPPRPHESAAGAMLGLLRSAAVAAARASRGGAALPGAVARAPVASLPFIPTDWVFRFAPSICRDRAPLGPRKSPVRVDSGHLLGRIGVVWRRPAPGPRTSSDRDRWARAPRRRARRRLVQAVAGPAS